MEHIALDPQIISITWTLLCTALVLLMQPGFTCFESGLVRSKNNINVALKNVADFCISGVCFWLIGYGLMYGASQSGLFGKDQFALNSYDDPSVLAYFLFQMMFCGTAATILSGAVAERMRFSGYIICAFLTATLLFPIVGHWIWHGKHFEQAPLGWLFERGFIDFAGATVVHSVGGWIALVALIIVGPRLGRFTSEGKPKELYCQNLPLSALGTFLLFIGWFGFNGGSVHSPNSELARVFSNTALSACAGGVSALLLSWNLHSMQGIRYVLNGLLAGLVAISASADLVNLPSAVVIGAIAGCISVLLGDFLEKYKIDDVVGAVPVHLGGGVWGTLAIAFFAPLEKLEHGSHTEQLMVQLLGIGVCAVWVCVIGFGVLWLINRFHPLRVSAQTETIGLNFGEHGMKDELIDLMEQFDKISKNENNPQHLNVDHGSNNASLCMTYNYLLDHTSRHFKAREDELLRLASLDPLTGIPNRRVYEQVLQNTLDESKKLKLEFCLLVIDVDNFKQYNDHYGHQLGDYCLQNVCQAISTKLTVKNSLLARIGGEEFAIIMPNTKLESAKSIAQGIRRAVCELEIPHRAAEGEFVTVSIGGACWKHTREISAQQLFDESDMALFQAKRNGRNQVCFSYDDDTLSD
ncbi:ammonium transporter [Pseudoalteromonas luteoviolacea]|uniref:ammonium transporter n=1 Tax=Pseudoalteromonas luteoviolacea TaxID=43657 RepID=UPI001EED99BD|nr:ammonium transporter [Pseudoalteromonas luteoviolacea]MCF6442278.1 ammonium transporter [Pseudoalteromonas luteoviolacea]